MNGSETSLTLEYCIYGFLFFLKDSYFKSRYNLIHYNFLHLYVILLLAKNKANFGWLPKEDNPIHLMSIHAFLLVQAGSHWEASHLSKQFH